MAANSALNPTLLDVAKRTDPNGKIDVITEMLAETNEWMLDASAVEANDGTGHKTTVRSGIPAGTWRKLNYGVMPEKSTTVQVRDGCGMLESYAEVDVDLANLNGNSAAFRLSEDRAFIEGMGQTASDTLFLGDTDVDPERFMGLGPRFDSLSAENGGNIINGGGNTGNTSIWLVGWSPMACHLIYPKGSKAGLSHKDLGQVTKTHAGGELSEVLRTHYKWDIGLTVRDWRYVVRIANIKVADLVKNAASGADLVDLMMQATELPPGNGAGMRFSFLCNRTVRSVLRRQITNRANVNLTFDTVAGKRVLAFDEIPVRRCDSILNTEAAIS